MKNFQKLLFALALVLVLMAAVGVRPAAANACTGQAVQIAESTQCVQDQLQPLRNSNLYHESRTVTDNGDGTVTVTFIFTPKCGTCGLATRIVTAVIDCATGTATCP